MEKRKYEIMALHGANGRTYALSNLKKVDSNFLKSFIEESLKSEINNEAPFYSQIVKITDKKELNVANLELTITGTDYVENFKNNTYKIDSSGKLVSDKTYNTDTTEVDPNIMELINQENDISKIATIAPNTFEKDLKDRKVTIGPRGGIHDVNVSDYKTKKLLQIKNYDSKAE